MALKGAVISPRNWVELTNVVLNGAFDNLATAPETKPVPLIVRRNACPPASMGSGDALVITGEVAAAAPATRTQDSQTLNQVTRRLMDTMALRIVVRATRLNSQEFLRTFWYSGET